MQEWDVQKDGLSEGGEKAGEKGMCSVAALIPCKRVVQDGGASDAGRA